MTRTRTTMIFSLLIAAATIFTIGCEDRGDPDDGTPADSSTTTAKDVGSDATDLIIVMHGHLAEDWMPYLSPDLDVINQEQTREVVDLLIDTTTLLEANGAVANIHFSYGVAAALCATEPDLLDDLQASGNEIGIHTHGMEDVGRVVAALGSCDITPTSASGMAFEVGRAAPGTELEVAAEWLEAQRSVGITTVTASIGSGRGGLAGACTDYGGSTFNDLAGTVGQAWSPAADDLCAEGDGPSTIVPHAATPSGTGGEPGATRVPGRPLAAGDFDTWLPQLGAALEADLPVWGLVVAFAALTEGESTALWLEGLQEVFDTYATEFASGELVSVTATGNATR